MNKQEILDFVAPKLIAQGVGSKKGEACLYRGPNNTKCAIGFLIEDDELATQMDEQGMQLTNTSIGHYINNKTVPLPAYFYEIDAEFFGALQAVHDHSTWYDIRKDLVRFAKNQKLEINF